MLGYTQYSMLVKWAITHRFMKLSMDSPPNVCGAKAKYSPLIGTLMKFLDRETSTREKVKKECQWVYLGISTAENCIPQ